jgi:hypothetical protein
LVARLRRRTVLGEPVTMYLSASANECAIWVL